MYGQDPGFFLDQSQTAGLKSKLFGFEFTPDGVNASKGAYDSVGWTFAYDYFDADNPISPLAKLFVDEFKAEYGEDPDFYAANFYENTLVMWEVIRRVLAKGGDINDGTQLEAALKDNLTVVERLRRRREHRRHLHARPDDPLGGRSGRWACSSTRTRRSRRSPTTASTARTSRLV